MYVITGATGNTGHEIAQALLKAGKQVKVISRSAEKVKKLTDQGAVAAIGDLGDSAFLTETFKGAEAIYTMIPPKFDLTDWPAHIRKTAQSLEAAIKASGVKYVVNLSSLGSERPDAGPVSGVGEFEKMLNAIPGLNVVHLHAGYFMQNLFANIDMIKHMGINGSSLKPDIKIPFVHTSDIAQVATKALLDLNFSGASVKIVAGAADHTLEEVTKIIGKAIGKPELPYVQFSYADAKDGMLKAGLPETIADGYNLLFKCVNDGYYFNEYKRTAENTTPTTLAHFVATELAPAFA